MFPHARAFLYACPCYVRGLGFEARCRQGAIVWIHIGVRSKQVSQARGFRFRVRVKVHAVGTVDQTGRGVTGPDANYSM